MRTLVLSTAVLALTACGSGTGPESGSRVGLGFQLARTSTASAMLASGSASLDGTPYTGVPPTVAFTADGLRITRDADVIVITKAQLVVRDVKLKSAVAACLDDDDDGSAIRLGGSPDDDDCPEFRVGPFLVDLPVTGAAGARLSVPVPPGTYSSVRLRLHKVTSSDGADAAFRQANPDFRDISVRLQGTYNGTPFIFADAQMRASQIESWCWELPRQASRTIVGVRSRTRQDWTSRPTWSSATCGTSGSGRRRVVAL